MSPLGRHCRPSGACTSALIDTWGLRPRLCTAAPPGLRATAAQPVQMTARHLGSPAPKGLHPTAQGRAAHPGSRNPNRFSTPKGLHNRRPPAPLWNPFGVHRWLFSHYPGCAARPWAMECNPVGVNRLQLPKFKKTLAELKTGLDKWLYFFRHAATIDTEAIPGILR